MRDPNIITMSAKWLSSLNETQTDIGDGYVPARAEGFSSLRYRIRATWLVWTGRADALLWPGQ